MVHGVFDPLTNADHSQVAVRFQPLYCRHASSPRRASYPRDRVEAGPSVVAGFVAIEMPANACRDPAVPSRQSGIPTELTLPKLFEFLELHRAHLCRCRASPTSRARIFRAKRTRCFFARL